MGAAVSIVDFDRDGWSDIYVTNSGEGSRNALYRNLGDGTFKDVAPELGIADLNQSGTGVSMGSVWGDYDNDGFEDLLLIKWGRPELFPQRQRTWLHSRNRASRDCPAGSMPIPRSGSTMTAMGCWTSSSAATIRKRSISGISSRPGSCPRASSTQKMAAANICCTISATADSKKSAPNWESTVDVGRWLPRRWTCAARVIPDLFIANDYGVSELYFNDGTRFHDVG
jgi:hypothetical protein